MIQIQNGEKQMDLHARRQWGVDRRRRSLTKRLSVFLQARHYSFSPCGTCELDTRLALPSIQSTARTRLSLADEMDQPLINQEPTAERADRERTSHLHVDARAVPRAWRLIVCSLQHIHTSFAPSQQRRKRSIAQPACGMGTLSPPNQSTDSAGAVHMLYYTTSHFGSSQGLENTSSCQKIGRTYRFKKAT